MCRACRGWSQCRPTDDDNATLAWVSARSSASRPGIYVGVSHASIAALASSSVYWRCGGADRRASVGGVRGRHRSRRPARRGCGHARYATGQAVTRRARGRRDLDEFVVAAQVCVAAGARWLLEDPHAIEIAHGLCCRDGGTHSMSPAGSSSSGQPCSAAALSPMTIASASRSPSCWTMSTRRTWWRATRSASSTSTSLASSP